MKDMTLKSPLPMLAALGRKLRPYMAVIFFLFFAAVYGHMVLKINSYSNPVIGDDEVIGEAKSSPTPRLDEDAAKKLESLQDNSVNVQTLFDESRASPFQE